MVIVQTEDFNSAELIAGLHERTATHAGVYRLRSRLRDQTGNTHVVPGALPGNVRT